MKRLASLPCAPFVALVLAALALGSPARAEIIDPSAMPGPLKDVRIDQQLGAALPLELPFRDEAGREVRLGDYFGERPVVLSFVYYGCPMLCTLALDGLAKSLGVVKFDVGQEFDVVVVSFDPDETPVMAAEAERKTVERYGRPATADGWHFLTGSQEAITQLTRAAGFFYAYDAESDEYAHASGLIVVTPEGKIAQYYFGIDYSPKDVQLAVIEASDERIGSLIDHVFLYCFRYDPKLGKYTAVTLRILRLSGAVFIAVLALVLGTLWWRERAPHPEAHARSGAA